MNNPNEVRKYAVTPRPAASGLSIYIYGESGVDGRNDGYRFFRVCASQVPALRPGCGTEEGGAFGAVKKVAIPVSPFLGAARIGVVRGMEETRAQRL